MVLSMTDNPMVTMSPIRIGRRWAPRRTPGGWGATGRAVIWDLVYRQSRFRPWRPSADAGRAVQAGQAGLGDALLLGQPAQQGRQLPALRSGERGADLAGVPGTGLLRLAELGPALIGQVEGVGTPVGGIAPALDQPALFQLVDQEDHAGGVEPHELPDGLL